MWALTNPNERPKYLGQFGGCLKSTFYRSFCLVFFLRQKAAKSYCHEPIDIPLCTTRTTKLIVYPCSSCSQNNPCSHPIFFMNGVKQSILKSILDFMYLGEVRINQEDFADFIRVAELFKIRGVTRDAVNLFGFSCIVVPFCLITSHCRIQMPPIPPRI